MSIIFDYAGIRRALQGPPQREFVVGDIIRSADNVTTTYFRAQAWVDEYYASKTPARIYGPAPHHKVGIRHPTDMGQDQFFPGVNP